MTCGPVVRESRRRERVAMRFGLSVAVMFAVGLLMGCSSSDDASSSEDSGVHQAAQAGPTPASLDAFSFQITLGEPFRIDASPLPVAVFHDVTNETEEVLRPFSRINGVFTVADDTGRQRSPASFATHPFDASATFALQAEKEHPRECVARSCWA